MVQAARLCSGRNGDNTDRKANQRVAHGAMQLVYCAAGNARFAQIAIDAGFKYGAQVPNTVYFPLWFCDQDWKRPNRDKYMAALAQHKPHMASVLDWERQEQLLEVLAWAEDAAQYVEVIMLIPKVQGGVVQLPRTIGGKPVRLGYSVPTSFGGTSLGLWEFSNWPVHLLGGSPQAQLQCARYLKVVSADGNAAQKAAVNWCMVWRGGKWAKLFDVMDRVEDDAPYVAFELSCRNIMQAWKKQEPQS